jgi:hypothetical protein
MRKLIVSSVIASVLLLSVASHAQVYNTAQKLKSGTFRLCTAPILIVDHQDGNAGHSERAGDGITRSRDLY